MEWITPASTHGAEALNVDPTSPVELAARQAWLADPRLRAEFGDNFGRYLAYEKAVARGLVKIAGRRPRDESL